MKDTRKKRNIKGGKNIKREEKNIKTLILIQNGACIKPFWDWILEFLNGFTYEKNCLCLAILKYSSIQWCTWCVSD